MHPKLFRNKYRNDTVRAPWHNYNGGAYFITICTKNREHFFGEISVGSPQQNGPTTNDEPVMHLSSIGRYTQQCIEQIPMHNPYAQVPLFVVMPDHIHLIVLIDETKIPHEKRILSHMVGTFHRDVGTFHETSPQNATQMQSWLSVVIRQFKSAVTRYARENAIPFAWQPRFHDHIIRDQTEMNRIAQYIENNVAQWGVDKL